MPRPEIGLMLRMMLRACSRVTRDQGGSGARGSRTSSPCARSRGSWSRMCEDVFGSKQQARVKPLRVGWLKLLASDPRGARRSFSMQNVPTSRRSA
eukprot:2997887-Prymnesium_polylepis.2